MSHSMQLIPNDYVSRTPRNELGGLRTITIRKYTASIMLTYDDVFQGIMRSQFTFGDEFGVIKADDLDDPTRNMRILCGLVGERNLVLIDQHTNKPDYFKISNVLLATIMVEFVISPEKLELIIYGGKQGNNELSRMLRENFGITSLTPQVFSDMGVRNLCERLFTRLFYITFDPFDKEGWGTIQVAKFNSIRGHFIDAEVERMKQVLDNKEIVIRSFKSIMHNQNIAPLGDYYDIKFEVLQDRGVSIEMPELKLTPDKSDLAYETIVYDFARQSYARIVGDEEMYEKKPQKERDENEPIQLELF